MAKKKTSRALPVGAQVKIKAEVALPEFPQFLCAGWTGKVIDTLGKKSDPRYVIEWDETIIDAMPSEYVTQCEAQNLFYRYVCLTRDEIMPVED